MPNGNLWRLLHANCMGTTHAIDIFMKLVSDNIKRIAMAHNNYALEVCNFLGPCYCSYISAVLPYTYGPFGQPHN